MPMVVVIGRRPGGIDAEADGRRRRLTFKIRTLFSERISASKRVHTPSYTLYAPPAISIPASRVSHLVHDLDTWSRELPHDENIAAAES